MTKRIGVLSLILAAGMAIFQPVAALAQDRNYRDRDFREQSSRREQHNFQERQRRDFRRDDRRGQDWRRQNFSRPYVGGSFSYGYIATRYYQPVRPYNCR
jgi:hypothetical protein